MIELVRDKNWQSLLTNYMDTATAKTAEWGVFDCALNCADAVLAITHTDIAPQIRGQYTNAEEADDLLRSLGFDNTFDYAASYLPQDLPCNGFSGDLAAFELFGIKVVGVIYAGRVFSPSPGQRGMGSVNLLRATTVFKVGTP